MRPLSGYQKSGPWAGATGSTSESAPSFAAYRPASGGSAARPVTLQKRVDHEQYMGQRAFGQVAGMECPPGRRSLAELTQDVPSHASHQTQSTDHYGRGAKGAAITIRCGAGRPGKKRRPNK